MNSYSHKPNLFVVGAAKSGTTSLYKYLRAHPEIYMSPIKEPHFFSADTVASNKNTAHKDSEYLHQQKVDDLGEYELLFKEGISHRYRGECSPSYLWSKRAPSRIYSYQPNAKIIIILRDPIDRAYSHYMADLSAGYQSSTSFYDAIMHDENMQPRIWGETHLYKDLGLYYEAVAEYINIFGRENVHIMLFKDFKEQTDLALQGVFKFLNLSWIGAGYKVDTSKSYNSYVGPNKMFYPIKNLISSIGLLNHVFSIPVVRNVLKILLYRKKSNKVRDIKAVNYLSAIYEKDLTKLQSLLNENVSYLFSSLNTSNLDQIK